MTRIRQWLESRGMGQYAEAFESNDMDLDLLPELTHEALRDLGVASLGHRLRLLTAIKGENATAAGSRAVGGDDQLAGASAASSLGERRQATVLFSDLSGYTAMNERLDPEEVRSIVGRIKAEAVRIVEGHGGIVNQFVGDEVMALFGVPLAHEDDPVRAVRAARDLHAMVRDLAPVVESRIGAPLRLHSGISAGLVVTGTEDGRDGAVGVTGDAVNTGARLAAHAEADAILVSEEIQRAIVDYFQAEPLMAVELRGKAGRVTPYRVAGQTGVTSRFEAAAQRGFTTYAGRKDELDVLNVALAKACDGQGQLVTVMGEPGIGKSRLLFEFRHSLPVDAVSVITGYCQSYGNDTPYLPIVDAIKRALHLDAVKSAEALHDQVVAAVRALSPTLEDDLPHLLHLLSIPSQSHTLPPSLQGDALRRSFEEAWAAIIKAHASRQPLILIFEDWHWADEASESALRHLRGLMPHLALLVIVTYRPEYEPRWGGAQNHHPVVLQPLGEEETAAMLGSVWRAARLPKGIAAQVHARTGGNALFNEEVARALSEDGRVRVSEGVAVLADGLSDLQLPDTVHAVIRARVDRLNPVARQVLRVASVVGREFALPLLEELHPSPSDIPAALELLARQDLILPLRVVPEPAYLFKHALVQDVVYETLLLSQRKEWHARTGAAIEALYVGRIEEHYEALATHYSKTDLRDKALQYLERAGDKVLGLSQAGPAMEYYGRAVSLLGASALSVDAKRLWVRIGLKWGRLSWARPAGVLEELDRISRAASDLEDRDAAAKLVAFAGIAALYTGDMRAYQYFERALDLAGPGGDLEARGLALQGLGQIKVFNLELEPGLELNQHAAALLAQLGTTTFHRVNALGLAMIAGARLGRPSVSKEMWRLMELAMHGNEDEGWWTWWNFYRSNSQSMLGDWDNGAHYSRRGIEQGTASLNAWGKVCCQMIHGICRFWNGEPAKGLETYENGLQHHLEISGAQVLSWWHGILAELLIVAGKDKEAVRHLDESRVSVERGDVTGITFAFRAAGLIATMRGDYADAVKEFRKGIQFSKARTMLPDLSITQLRFAECLHKQGDLAGALEQVDEVKELFDGMAMNWWGRQASELRGRIEGGEKFVWFAPYARGFPSV